MASYRTNVLLVFISLLSLSSNPSSSDRASLPEFAFSWMDDKDTFVAGEIATVKIRALTNLDKLNKTTFKPIVTIDEKIGNSSIVSGVLSDFEGDPSSWKLHFTTMTAGLFNVLITEDQYKVLDSSLHFLVQPGRIYPSVCFASWIGFVHEFEAGDQARVQIVPRDAFGNNRINETSKDPRVHNFTVSVFHANDSFASLPNITHLGWNQFGYIAMEFNVVKAGDFLLHVEGGNQSLNGSPLPFKVNPGPLEVSNCEVKWDFEPNAWQLYSKMEIFIHQQDHYSNLVPGLYEFDAEVVEIETNLSIPVPDLHFEEVAPGIQRFSFTNIESGHFLLTISDMKHDKCISHMPYAYTVFVGYCDGTSSVVNGTGLNSSMAGERSEFSVYLNDAYHNPTPVEIERLEVQIVRDIDSYSVQSSNFPIHIINGSGHAQGSRFGTTNQIGFGPSPAMTSINSTVGGFSTLATAFNVVYTPDKSGTYTILVFCGNIVLNGGLPFSKQVIAGSVDPSRSTVVKYSSKVARMINNAVVVQLVDSFSNPVLSQQSRVKLEIDSVNSSGLSSSLFVDNTDGSYTVHYMVKEVGTFEICASFDGKRISSCPFQINVYTSEYFPRAENDTISVWEDESIAFDVLENDYFAFDASVVEFSKPGHGSLIEYGRLLRYTPYKEYYGNDSFVYVMSDINGNFATAPVNISVLTIPPEVASYPSELQATEDEINPKFGGFSGFVIRYSDIMENISVNLSAQYGTVFLSPMLMQFWDPIWNGFSVYKEDAGVKGLILQGSVEAVNFALHSIQYYGNDNFCGYDTIRLTTQNRNGVNDLYIPVFVEPINDPPFIHVPEFIILKSNEDESLIYDRETDKFEFSIGDPDLLAFTGNESLFLVIFSMEVNDGYLITTLPAELINTVEVKMKNSYQWLPLQTYVTISKHFTVKAKGIRLHATLNECNTVMQQLFYHGGGEQDVILSMTLNDLGNYGCYVNCTGLVTTPLLVEASLNLIRKMPMSSLVARGLGSAIIIESIIVFSLGAAVIFFTCKCATILVNERRNRATGSPAEPAIETLSKRTSPQQLNKSLSENAAHLTTSCSSPLLGSSSRRRDFQLRFRRQYENGESSKAAASEYIQQNPAPKFQPFCVEKEPSDPV